MKLLKYLIIRATTRHALTAIGIYERIYTPVTKSTISSVTTNVTPVSVPKTTNKKQELSDSLKYLKEKPIKTSKDKNSISMLEGILANM